AAAGLQARLDYLEGRYHTALHTYLAMQDMDSVEAVYRELPASEQKTLRPRLFTTYLAHHATFLAETVYKDLSEEEQGKPNLLYMASYLRQLAGARDYDHYEQAIVQLDHLRARLNPAEAAQFSRQLLQNPDLAAPYFYYRLYHTETKPADLKHLAQLAD